MIVRVPTLNDAVAISQLSSELGYTVDTDVMAKRLSNLLQRNADYLRVAEIDSHVVGWIQAHISESLESGCRAEIVGLVVAPRFRRNGVGRALVNDAINWSANQGIDTVMV